MAETSRITHLFEKAEESLADAELLIEKGDWESAALRCYHAVFFSLRAQLMADETGIGRASESIDIIRVKVREGLFDAGAFSNAMYVLRLNGFEMPAVEIDPASVKEGLRRADEFCQLIRQN